ncbi:MAG: sce7726 family protein [Armatimonadetes bacterium]|nr:sce7726 family protein [Armatimonadota bacterium]
MATSKLSSCDADIRAAMVQRLAKHYEGDLDTVILEEVSMGCGAPRIDLLVVNGALEGFELKSDRDTLRRLPRQARFYTSVLDRMTLVVGPRHLDEAREIVPSWWGLALAEGSAPARISLSTIREAQQNPSPDPMAIARLLWKEEAFSLLDEIGAADGFRSKPRGHIHARLVDSCHIDTIRRCVRQRFRTRTDWKSDVRRKSGGG